MFLTEFFVCIISQSRITYRPKKSLYFLSWKKKGWRTKNNEANLKTTKFQPPLWIKVLEFIEGYFREILIVIFHCFNSSDEVSNFSLGI